MKITKEGFPVYLESLSESDVNEIAENANDYDIAYNVAEWGSFPYPYTVKDAIGFVNFAKSALLNKTEFHFVIRGAQANEFIGVCGIKNADYKNRKCEIGYWIAKKHWRKGKATSAIELLLGFAFQKMNMNRVYAIAFDFNAGSLALLEKIGFTKEGVLREDVLHKDGFVNNAVYSMLRNEHKEINISVQ